MSRVSSFWGGQWGGGNFEELALESLKGGGGRVNERHYVFPAMQLCRIMTMSHFINILNIHCTHSVECHVAVKKNVAHLYVAQSVSPRDK